MTVYKFVLQLEPGTAGTKLVKVNSSYVGKKRFKSEEVFHRYNQPIKATDVSHYNMLIFMYTLNTVSILHTYGNTAKYKF